MERRLEDFIAAVSAAGSIEAVGAALEAELRAEGFENLVFAETRNGALRDLVWASLPDGYARTYLEEGWGDIDPVLRKAMASTRAFSWESVNRPDAISRAQRRFFSECAEMGVRSGLTIPLHGPGGRVDLLSLSMREKDAPAAPRLRHLHAVSMQAWLRRSELAEPPAVAPPKLSPREIECLKWLREGKSNWEISQILAISEKTAEFHVGNIMKKFQAESRLAAVILALRAGVIPL